MKVKFTNIVWDHDDLENLPTEVTLNMDVDSDPAEDGANLLSDRFDCTIKSLSFEILEV